jgi:hypothetical protein
MLKVVNALSSLLLGGALIFSASAQTLKYDAKRPPHFQDFPATEIWKQPPAPLKLATGSERMFRTQLTNAAKRPADFAGHYTMAFWGCGSNCSAAALIDLKMGAVYQPPLATPDANGWDRWIMCPGSFEGTGDEFHVDSRLMIVRCGMNYSEQLQKNVPDTWYFLWEQNGFRQLLYISGKSTPLKN